MRSHLFRVNGTWYFRYALSEKLVTALQVHQYREIRLSLYTTNHVYARELANAYWLACRELIHSDLQALSIVTIDDFKSHVRKSVMSHLPQKFTPLIELVGSTESDKLVAAVKTLSAFNAVFFVLPPPTIKGTISKKVITSSCGSWDWTKLASVNEQQLPHMRLPAHMLQDAITAGQNWVQPEYLFNTVKGEEQMLRIAVEWRIGLHQLFIQSDLQQHIYTAVRKLTDTPSVAQSTSTTVVKPSPLLSAEIESYFAFKTRKWAPKTKDEFRGHLDVFLEMVGKDKEILQLTNDDYDYYIQNLPRLPPNKNKDKRYRGKTIKEILAMEPTEVIKKKTVETYYGTVRGFFKWAAPPRNPGLNLTILNMAPESNERDSDGRLPFTPEHLSLMFESEKSLTFLSTVEHPYQIWITPIAAVTGARIGEICALRLKDIGIENNIPYIQFNDAEGEDKTRKGKTKNSVRKVPMHPILVSLGLLRFADYMRALPPDQTDNGRLFPECTYVEKHGYRKSASRWWNNDYKVDVLGITDEKMVFHCWRNTVADQLTQQDALKEWRISRYFGHKLPKDAPESIRSYFRQKKLEHLLPVIDVIKYNIDWTRYELLCRKTYTK